MTVGKVDAVKCVSLSSAAAAVSDNNFLKRAIRKCLIVMRQKLNYNKKMLSVVSAGAAAGVGGMERLRGGRAAGRELAGARDRQVRLHAVRTDLAINLPTSIPMPDGEDHPYSASRLHIRDSEQESEIYQKCIRAPPNRTVLESESPPPYRSSSAGLLGSSCSDWSAGSGPLVVRCHSMSSSSSSSTSSNSTSTSSAAAKRTEPGASQKTDFLQRTVKIFTGKKSSQHQQQQHQHQQQSTAATTALPAVIVPTGRPQRRTSDHPHQYHPHLHQPQPQQHQPHHQTQHHQHQPHQTQHNQHQPHQTQQHLHQTQQHLHQTQNSAASSASSPSSSAAAAAASSSSTSPSSSCPIGRPKPTGV